MHSVPPNPELDRLIQASLDGGLDPCDQASLSALLQADVEARRTFLESSYLDSLLWTEFEGPVKKNRAEVASQTQKPVPFRKLYRVALAVAAMVVFGAVAVHFLLPPGAPSHLELTNSPDAIWENSERNTSRIYPADQITLSQGILGLRFPGGSTAVIEAPAKFTLESVQSLTFRKGTAYFDITPADTGLKIGLPGLDLVDHGTKFGIEIGDGSAPEVHVFDGEVLVTDVANPASQMTLVKDSALRLRAFKSGSALQRIPAAHKFATTIPTAESYLHWTFDEVISNVTPASGNLASLHRAQGRLVGESQFNVPSPVLGKFGSALNFKGPRQAVATGFSGLPSSPRTIACWFRQEKNRDAPAFVSLSDSTGRSLWSMGLSTDSDPGIPHGVPVLRIGTAKAWVDQHVSDNNWRHIAITWDPASPSIPQFYLNGNPREVRLENWPPSLKEPNTVNPADLTFGDSSAQTGNSTRLSEGNIDDVWFFPRNLPLDTIRQLFRNKFPSNN